MDRETLQVGKVIHGRISDQLDGYVLAGFLADNYEPVIIQQHGNDKKTILALASLLNNAANNLQDIESHQIGEALHGGISEFLSGYVLVGFLADSGESVVALHGNDEKTILALATLLNSAANNLPDIT